MARATPNESTNPVPAMLLASSLFLMAWGAYGTWAGVKLFSIYFSSNTPLEVKDYIDHHPSGLLFAVLQPFCLFYGMWLFWLRVKLEWAKPPVPSTSASLAATQDSEVKEEKKTWYDSETKGLINVCAMLCGLCIPGFGFLFDEWHRSVQPPPVYLILLVVIAAIPIVALTYLALKIRAKLTV